MELKLAGKVSDIHEISSQEFNTFKINSISRLYPKERQESKAPTFALT